MPSRKSFTSLTPENVVDFILTFKPKTEIVIPGSNEDGDLITFTPAEWEKRKTLTVQTVPVDIDVYDEQSVIGPNGDTSRVIIRPARLKKEKVVQIGRTFFDTRVIAKAEQQTVIYLPENTLYYLNHEMPHYDIRITATRFAIGCQDHSWAWWANKKNREVLYMGRMFLSSRADMLNAVLAGRKRLIEKVT